MFHGDIPNGEVTKNFSEQFNLFHSIYTKKYTSDQRFGDLFQKAYPIFNKML